MHVAVPLVNANLKDTEIFFTDLEYLWKMIVLDRVFNKNPLFLSLDCTERSETAISLKNKLKVIINHIPIDWMIIFMKMKNYHFDKILLFKLCCIILILFYLSNKHFLYNIKQKCIFKSLLLGVLYANFGHFLS